MGKQTLLTQAIAEDSLSWLNFGFQLSSEREMVDRQKKTVHKILSNLYGSNIPGMILGDEVGMGKTYVALGVIAAVCRKRPLARIVVLTHNNIMARKWMSCWKQMCDCKAFGILSQSLPNYYSLASLEELDSKGIYFGSYDKLKHVSTEHQRVILERVMSGRYLRLSTKRMLRKQIFASWAAPSVLWERELRKTPQTDLDRVWQHYIDRETGWNSWYAVTEQLRRLVYKSIRTKHQIDLLIIDEAHKLEARQRNMFFEEVLHERTERALYLTATPFAMDIEELFNRIKDIHSVTGRHDDGISDLKQNLEEFRNTVSVGNDLNEVLKKHIEEKLGKYLVRSTWPDHFRGTKKSRRHIISLKADLGNKHSEKYLYATLALETAFVKLQKSSLKSHRAAHRTTLCSSYAAIGDASMKPQTSASWRNLMGKLRDLLPPGESPKFLKAVQYLAECASARKKVLVFANRLATISELARQVNKEISPQVQQSRRVWNNIRNRLRERGENKFLFEHASELRLAAHAGLSVGNDSVKQAILKQEQRLENSFGSWDDDNRVTLNEIWGKGRHIGWVETLTGKTRNNDDIGHSKEDVIFSFNLPGPPYILICTNIAGEGIDLHRECRRIMHYDLEWNPAILEQKIGRIDRINSLSQREQKPVEVIYVWQQGTYEERIVKKVKERLLLMHTVLGAGHFLSDEPEEQRMFDNLERYRLFFGVKCNQ